MGCLNFENVFSSCTSLSGLVYQHVLEKVGQSLGGKKSNLF